MNLATAENVLSEDTKDAPFFLTVDGFEGPLDLLLHLVQKHELNIVDLPISFITEKYLSYLDLMTQFRLDVAAEYLVMAATLAHIKSKMLLPTPPTEQDDTALLEEIDPRADLIRRLLEYQKYKAVGEELGSREVAGRDVFMRGAPAPEAQGQAPLAEFGVFKLLDAFQAALKKKHGSAAFSITAERVSIQDRMMQITDRLLAEKRVRLEALLDEGYQLYDVVVTFLAMLEMAKLHMLRVYQAEGLSEIYLESAVAAVSALGEDEAPRLEGDDVVGYASPASSEVEQPAAASPDELEVYASGTDEVHATGGEPLHTAEAEELHTAEAEELHAAEAEELHAAEAEELHAAEAEELHAAEAEELHAAEAEELHAAEAEELHAAEVEELHAAEAEELHTAEAEELHTGEAEELHTAEAEEISETAPGDSTRTENEEEPS